MNDQKDVSPTLATLPTIPAMSKLKSEEAMVGFLNPDEHIEEFGLREGDSVADFGAGSGAYALLAAQAVGENGKVYAVDVQREFLPLIRAKAIAAGRKNIEVIWGDFELPGGSTLRDGIADAVLLANTLFQLEDKIGAAREAKRVLKPDGKAIVIDWLDSFGNLGPAKEMVVAKEMARKIFEDAGFSFVKEISAGKYHYGMIFLKKETPSTEPNP